MVSWPPAVSHPWPRRQLSCTEVEAPSAAGGEMGSFGATCSQVFTARQGHGRQSRVSWDRVSLGPSSEGIGNVTKGEGLWADNARPPMALPSSWAARSVMSEWPSCAQAPEGMIPGCLEGPACSGSLPQSVAVRQAPTSSAASGPAALLSTRRPHGCGRV